ncbi:MAG: CARDB domain-containing protein, partial [Solirubrobacterales bacterium]
VGIYMEGALVNGTLEVAITQLTADSATAEFNLNIPGTDSPFANRRGVDKTYVQAKCSTGTWLLNTTFELGSRDAANNPTTPTETVVAPQTSESCVGLAGNAKLKNKSVKGPSKVKKGKKGTFKVKVTNNGTAIAKNLKVVVQGKGVSGKQSAGKLAPGASKTIKVKAKFKKKGKIKATFKTTAGKVKATSKKTVKVK